LTTAVNTAAGGIVTAVNDWCMHEWIHEWISHATAELRHCGVSADVGHTKNWAPL